MIRLRFGLAMLLGLATCTTNDDTDVGKVGQALCEPPNLPHTSYQVTTTPDHEYTPTVGSFQGQARVVYTRLSTNGSNGFNLGDIYHQEVNDVGTVGAPELITSLASDDQLNDTHGQYIVFTAYDANLPATGRIMLHDVATATTTTLTSLRPVGEAHVHNNYVAWLQDNNEIWLHDITTAQSALIASGNVSDIDIGDEYVVWVDSGVSGDVYAYRLSDGLTLPVATDLNREETAPTTAGAWVAYQVHDPAASSIDIHVRSFDTAELIVVAANGAFNMLPSMSGNRIAYESDVGGNFDVYVAICQPDCANCPTTCDSFQATTHPSDQRLSHIHDNLITYADVRNGDWDVFVTNLDADGDGDLDFSDCALFDPAVHHAAAEICNDGIDNDCDCAIDANDDDCSVGDPAATVCATIPDMVASLTAAEPPGVDGLTNKLTGKSGVEARVCGAAADYADGLIDLATYVAGLQSGLDKLGAFDNQLAAKIGNGQISEPHASYLQTASAEIRALIEDMIANAS